MQVTGEGGGGERGSYSPYSGCRLYYSEWGGLLPVVR